MEPNWQLARKRPTLEKRARIVHAIRAFFIERDFLEVETPLRIPTNAPEFHINAVASGDWFLHTSPELAMKRLLAAGYERLFQICHCWRDGERGQRHLPEYTMLEWYRSGCDYQILLTDCEELFVTLAKNDSLRYQGEVIDLTRPWPQLTVQEAFKNYASISVEQALTENCFDELLATEIEPQIATNRPLFLTEYPISQAALARQKPANPKVAERFELYIGGMELANAFSELIDATEQRQRFATEESKRRAAGKPAYPTAEPFLQELTTMPESAGIALGVDRLIMLFCDLNSIDDAVAFPPELL
jgi:lysyl-tRNA synthetase class 2